MKNILLLNCTKNGKPSIAGEETVNSILSLLPKPFENLWNIWKKGKHYALVDIS